MLDKISNSLLKTVLIHHIFQPSLIAKISQIAREVSCWQIVKWIQKYAHLALSVYEKGNQSHFAMKNVACMHALTPLHFMKRCDVENGVIFRRGGNFFMPEGILMYGVIEAAKKQGNNRSFNWKTNFGIFGWIFYNRDIINLLSNNY